MPYHSPCAARLASITIPARAILVVARRAANAPGRAPTRGAPTIGPSSSFNPCPDGAIHRISRPTDSASLRWANPRQAEKILLLIPHTEKHCEGTPIEESRGACCARRPSGGCFTMPLQSLTDPVHPNTRAAHAAAQSSRKPPCLSNTLKHLCTACRCRSSCRIPCTAK